MSKVMIYSPPSTAQIKRCSVDFDLRREPPKIYLVQYDKTLPVVEVALNKGGTAYQLPEDAEVNIRMGKRNKLAVYNPVLGCNEDRDRVYVEITTQMTTQEGVFDPILELMVGGGIAGTSPIQFIVQRNPVQDDAVEDETERKTIAEYARQASESASAAAKSAEDAGESVRVFQENEESIKFIQDNISDINAVAQNGSNISAVGGSIDSVNTVAENLTPIKEAVDNIEDIRQAKQNASEAADSATLSQSWAVGGTGTREGEDTDNAKYWCAEAQKVAQGALGWYENESALRSAHPTGKDGQWALVGDTDTIWTWDSDTSDWINTATRIDLSNYYTKAQVDSTVKTINSAIENANKAIIQANESINDTNGRIAPLESRVKNLNFMQPGDGATNDFLHAMGTGGVTADVTWERATDGNDYLVFTVQGTRVFAVRGFSGINTI